MNCLDSLSNQLIASPNTAWKYIVGEDVNESEISAANYALGLFGETTALCTLVPLGGLCGGAAMTLEFPVITVGFVGAVTLVTSLVATTVFSAPFMVGAAVGALYTVTTLGLSDQPLVALAANMLFTTAVVAVGASLAGASVGLLTIGGLAVVTHMAIMVNALALVSLVNIMEE